jgi:hypothetical protein
LTRTVKLQPSLQTVSPWGLDPTLSATIGAEDSAKYWL